MSAVGKRRAAALTSIFENGTATIAYDYTEELGDGRGVTCGRGFTTATGDARAVVARYAARVPDAEVVRFLPALTRLAAERSGDTATLAGFAAAWKRAAADPAFRDAQDELVDAQTFVPAMQLADAAGVQSELGRALLWDTVFMHGDGDDPDGAPALVAQATARAGGRVCDGIEERAWLEAFLRVRESDLRHPSDRASARVWNEATFRCDVFRAELGKNDQLAAPVHVHAGGIDATTD